MTKRVYAIDYDGTYTDNPRMWGRVLRIMKDYVDIICATSRSDTPANREQLFNDLEGKVIDIVYCGGKYKQQACREAGYDVVVWMDNDPRTDEHYAPLWWCRLVGAIQYIRRKLFGAKKQ
jgi:hypothetical protein